MEDAAFTFGVPLQCTTVYGYLPSVIAMPTANNSTRGTLSVSSVRRFLAARLGTSSLVSAGDRESRGSAPHSF